MRICLYTGSALPKLGGQEAVVDALARQFLALGHEPMVLAPRPRLPLRPDDSTLPYPVARHPRFYSTKLGVSWYRRWLQNLHSRHRFDIVHCHDVYPTGFVASLLKRQMKIPLVITSHGGDVREGNVRLAKPGMRPRFIRAVQAADALISIGRFTEQGFLALGADPKQIISIPNGVDLAPFRNQVARPSQLDTDIVPGKYFLFIGRLAARKGVDTLIEAMALLPADRDIRLVIAGSGEELESIEAQIAKLGVSDRVRLVGRASGETKTWLLQNALCTIMPSRGWEAFPLVVLESYAAGRPVIGSDIAGLQDLIQPDITGLLVKPDSPADLAVAMQRVIDDPLWAQRAGNTARAIAQDYGWDKIAQRHIAMYQHLINSKIASDAEL
jgi:glycosyltransferase involved in cell wall biosynthesis